MVIANTKAKSVYNANGVTREWPIDFVINQDVSKINILLEDASGEQTEVTTGYSLENNVVTYPTLESGLAPVAEGNKIIIFRTTPLTQEKDLADNIVESGLDKLTLQVQEISEQVGRAIKVPISEEGLSQYKNPITEIREETKKSLDEIQAATDVVSSYTAESATNAATSKEEADRAVEASNVSVMASSDAEAAAVMAENLSNEAKDAVSAYVNGLGAMRNSVIDLGLFESNQRRASSCIIDFDYEPLDVFIRFSDSERKMWIKGSHSFAGFEKIGDKKYKIFYSVSSEDFASQSAIKGPFYVQYVIKYSVFSGHPVTYRGRVDTVDQLPRTAEDGDLWYVGPVEQSNKEEYIWQEGKWELLGSTDFSRVYSKEEIDNKVSVIENDITDLENQVSEIEAKIPQEASADNQLATKEEINTGLSTKQDTITDLATIRSGAAAGATAVQPGDLATVATSGMYSDLTGTPGAATADTLGLVKPDGTTITVTEDGTISVPVSSEVATKAELQDKVSKAGDTMTGLLKISGNNEVRFGTDDYYYYVKKHTNGDLLIYNKDAKGLFLYSGDNKFAPYYFDGTKGYRLLTTEDKGVIVGWGMPDYSAGVDISSSLKAANSSWVAPSDGVIFAKVLNNDTVYLFRKSGCSALTYDYSQYTLIAINGEAYILLTDKADVRKGDIIYASTEANSGKIYFYPFKGVN